VVNLNEDFSKDFRPRPRYAVLLFSAGWMLFIGIYDVVGRLLTEVEGTVTSSQTSKGPRAATQYQILGSDGRIHEYIAGPTALSLPRRMPVGTQLKKTKYELAYTRDGVKIDDFPLLFYLVWVIGGLGLAIFVYIHSRRIRL
jgi:hypothetical protein